jgi:signal transduction histidine kinase/CheY-like chemotaxis protein
VAADHPLFPGLTPALVRWMNVSADRGVFVTDRHFRIVFWNQWLEAHSGRTSVRMVGRLLFEEYPDLVERGLDQFFQSALNGEVGVVSQPLHGHLLPIPVRLGDIRFANMPQRARIEPFVEGGASVGTEQELRRQIEAQEVARAAAERALRAKDEFLATLSHEMRNPLNAVLGWTRILRDRQVDPETLARAIDVIDRNATLQARMIDDLLDTARAMSGKLRLQMQPVDLGMVVLAALDVVMPVAQVKGVQLRHTLTAEAERVLGDADRLQQIVWNLFSNAVKFTHQGGTVDVSLEQAGRTLRLVVRDTGVGISTEFLPFVFERFRQEDASSARREGGLGLGLALVRELVELHGGSVSAASGGQGKGATFVLEFPTLADADTALFAAAPPPAARQLRGIRVLVVEDEADARELLSTVLTRDGAEVIAAESAEDAMAHICGANASVPHVLVSDIGLAGEDGYALIRRVRSLPPERGGSIPAVAVTGYANPDHRVRALSAGYQLHVAKPVAPAELVAAVRRVARPGDLA